MGARKAERELDFEFLVKLSHCYGYSLSRALTKLLGDAQGALVSSYAGELVELLGLFGMEPLDNLERYCQVLREKGVIEDYAIEHDTKDGKRFVTFAIKGCATAPFIHRGGRMRGYTGDVCPLAAIAMVVFARSRGWLRGESVFKYVRFAEKLSYFTEDGSETVFEVVGK